MTMAEEPAICSNLACKVSEGQPCVEGYTPIDTCPYFGKEPDARSMEKNEGGEKVELEQGILHLAEGEALSADQSFNVLNLLSTRVIGLVGPNAAGKTSLIAGIYDLFQEGPIGSTAFAGSATLFGFEQLCHHARAASRRDVPYQPRTHYGSDVTFFHLDVKRSDLSPVESLLIADRAGEDYVAVTHDISQAVRLFELRRADVITILVNGDGLIDDEERHETRVLLPSIIHGLLESSILFGGRRLAIVLTKQDAILQSPHPDRVKADFETMVESVRERYGAGFSNIEPFVIAASPQSQNVKRGEGLQKLLEFWLEPIDAPAVARPIIAEGRMFDVLQPREST